MTEPPLAILTDYDGTVSLTDVSDQVIATHGSAYMEGYGAAYVRGEVGSRWLWEREVAALAGDPERILGTAARQPHDPDFAAFAERARAAGIPVEVVSDGLGFFIEPALRQLGVGWIPVSTARTTLGRTGSTIEFPFANPTCAVCGTCKRERVRAHQAAGRAVVFIGDGTSDRFAAAYADVVFAKRALIPICEELGIPHLRFTGFAEIDRWLEATLSAWGRDPSTLPGPTARPLVCGAEVWPTERLSGEPRTAR